MKSLQTEILTLAALNTVLPEASYAIEATTLATLPMPLNKPPKKPPFWLSSLLDKSAKSRSELLARSEIEILDI